MIIINFTHPLTDSQQEQIELETNRSIARILDIPRRLDDEKRFAPQVIDWVNSIQLSTREWQQEFILVNPPAYAPAASVLIAELHGRMGYFPSIIRISPIPEITPNQFEFAEIIDLQKVRRQASKQRGEKNGSNT